MKLKNTKKRSPKMKIIILALVVLVLLPASGVLAWNYFQPRAENSSTKDENGIEYGPTTDEQQQAGYEIKEESQTPAESPGAGDPITLSITAPSPSVVTGSSAQIRLRIDIVASVGTCTLTLTKGSAVITQEAAIQQAGPTISTCQGFNVSGLTPGEWKMVIKVVSGDRQGSVSETLTVQ